MADQPQTGAAEVFTFSRPVFFEGTEYKELTLDYEKLTGDDILSCDRQYRAEQGKSGSISLAPETEKAYQAYVAARAAGVHVGVIRAASANDFTRITLRTRNFLLL